MKLALMQPYLFPYIGYFQLLASVDRFVFYDDVNYIKNGWINRNRFLLNGEVKYFTVPLSNASPFQKIRDVEISPPDLWRKKLLESMRHAYRKAPHFDAVHTMMEEVLSMNTTRISDLAKASVQAVAGYVGLTTKVVPTSSTYGNDDLRSAERVLEICRREGATAYHNVPGGRELYEAAQFAAQGLALHFIAPERIEYPQGKGPFQPWLSIIDVLMHNSPSRTRELLDAYTID